MRSVLHCIAAPPSVFDASVGRVEGERNPSFRATAEDLGEPLPQQRCVRAGDLHGFVAAPGAVTSRKSRAGRPNSFASNPRSAPLARPSSGGAVTDALSAADPSARGAIPSIRLARARGVSRTASRAPSVSALSGDDAAVASVRDRRGNIEIDQPPQKQGS
jgi:hypothetical protein